LTGVATAGVPEVMDAGRDLRHMRGGTEPATLSLRSVRLQPDLGPELP